MFMMDVTFNYSQDSTQRKKYNIIYSKKDLLLNRLSTSSYLSRRSPILHSVDFPWIQKLPVHVSAVYADMLLCTIRILQ